MSQEEKHETLAESFGWLVTFLCAIAVVIAAEAYVIHRVVAWFIWSAALYQHAVGVVIGRALFKTPRELKYTNRERLGHATDALFRCAFILLFAWAFHRVLS